MIFLYKGGEMPRLEAFGVSGSAPLIKGKFSAIVLVLVLNIFFLLLDVYPLSATMAFVLLKLCLFYLCPDSSEESIWWLDVGMNFVLYAV